jgi:2-polyprenyl-3-methyl-5-hydroxy-6-metoxy-1,4-benzoquinol methylase
MSAEQEITLVYSSQHFLSKDLDLSDRVVGEAWDRYANEWNKRYTELGDKNRQYIIDPSILNILGRVKGKRILDAGCGNGYLCRLLSTKGAKMMGARATKF